MNRFLVVSLLALPAFLIAGNADAQSEKSNAAASLEAAKQISAASGRPIFAIAGRST